MFNRVVHEFDISVVVGNAYGDEGKGLITDALSGGSTTVVRFNGGAQAGHTVELPDGRRHVFHSFGSGTLQGAKTFLSRFMCVDPIAIRNEHQQLIHGFPDLFDVNDVCMVVDCYSPVTTPWDWLLNQATEEARGDNRHGSCGYGVGETMRRHEESPYRLYAMDLTSPMLREKLLSLRPYYLDLQKRTGVSIDQRREEKSIELFLARASYLCENFSIQPFDLTGLRSRGNIVFEGAQGLLLDREIGFFPYVTRSRTGLHNVNRLIGGDWREVGVYFPRRWYMTRHGPGPLRGEVTSSTDLGCGILSDSTNQWNPWQGDFRFGRPDPVLLDWAIFRVWSELGIEDWPKRTRVVTTWMDRWPKEVTSVLDAQGQWLKREDVLRSSHLVALGPTRNDVNQM